jgi:catechol-2,3-dioxygenase
MPRAFRLVYLDLATDRHDDDLDFYTRVMGLKQMDAADGRTYLTLGYDHHNISLTKAAQPGLPAIGYQLTQGLTLAEMERLLREAGVKSVRKSDARAGVDALLEVEPIGGHTVQLMETVDAPAPGFADQGVSPISLGHFAVLSPEAARLNAFYRDVMQFYHTDAFGDAVKFYACNHEHHVLNIVEAPVAHRLHHVAFQLREYAAHARAADILSMDRRPIVWGPTRHTAGHNIASYFRDPASRLVELYTDMDVYLPDLDMMEPRPWHSELPMRPRVWQRGDLANWKTEFEFKMNQA